MSTFAVFALFLTLATPAADAQAREAIPECCASKFAWTDLTGREQTLEAYRGRYLVINFWASWCLPCREELPSLVEIQNRYGIFGVQVLGASADTAEHRDDVLALAQEFKLNFPVLLGANNEQMRLLGLGEAIPATVILDPDGKIVQRFDGVVTPEELERTLDSLIENNTPIRRAALDRPHAHDDEDHGHNHSGSSASLVPS